MFDVIYEFALWFVMGLTRVVAALIAIPIVFFLPRGPGYRHLSYVQTVRKRLRYCGKSIVTAFKNPL